MKIKAGTIVNRYNGKPVMIEQEVYLTEDGRPVVIGGQPQMTGGRPMTVGDIFSIILSTRRVDQFNVLKADVLARRFYLAEDVDIDEADYSGLLEVIERNDQFVPFVLAYARRALIEARDGAERRGRKSPA